MSEGPDARLLIEHASFVRRVARGILADEHAVEEIVQGTFLQALRRPPRGALRSWLGRVARNLAISRWRAERSRHGREVAAARPEPVSGPDEAAQRLETQRRVVEAVMALDEPYRMAIVHRYFDDLSPPEIAAHLGIPLGNVRTRLKRALAQLRARLEGRDRRAMVLALAPLAALSRGSAALLTGGTALMKAKTIVLVTCGILLSASLYLISSEGVRGPSRAADPEHAGVTTATDAAEHRDTPDAPTSTAAAAESSARLVVRGVVRAAAREALVEIRAETSRERPGEVVARATVPTGEAFAIPATDAESAPLALFVRARCPGHVPAEARTVVLLDVRTGEPHVPPVELTLGRAATLRGQVVDAHGAPARAATVAAVRLRSGAPEETAADTTTSDAHGRFELLVGEEGEHAVIATAPETRPATCIAEARLASATDLPPLRLETGAAVSGRVTVTGGSPAKGARVRAVLRAPRIRVPRTELEIAWSGGRGEWRVVDGLTDDGGRYAIAGLREGPYRVHLIGVEGGHPALARGGFPDGIETLLEERDALDDDALDEHFGTRPALVREVRAPQAGVDFEVPTATVEFVLVPGAAPPAEARLEVAAVDGIVSIVDQYDVGATLRRDLVVSPGAKLRVRSLAEGYEPRETEVAAPAAGMRETHRIELVAAPAKATLVVTLEPQGAEPLPALPTAFSAYLFRADRPGDDPVTRQVSLRVPEILLKGLDAGEYRLELFPGSMEQRAQNFYCKAVAEVRLRAGETSRLAVPLHAGGRLRILLSDPDGRTDIAAACTIVAPDGTSVGGGFAKFDAEGGTSMSMGGIPGRAGPAEVMQPLPPGRYAIRVQPFDATLRQKTVTAEIEVGRLTVAEIRLDR